VIVPSVDIMDGRAVQLVGGKGEPMDCGDPMAAAERFAVAGELAVIDLDAALGRGDNREQIEAIVRRFPCRVGGGIRSPEVALDWLDSGAQKVILGTAARPDVLARLPKERVIAALDANEGRIVIKGWTEATGQTVDEGLAELRALCGHFMVTFVEREGRLGGIDLEACARLAQGAQPASLTVAGGVTTVEELRDLDRLGIDAQVGMALYRDQLPLADAILAPLDRQKVVDLVPTVVVDEVGTALGLCWSNQESVHAAVRERRGIYWSRTRGLWRKGQTSGDVQELLRIDLDCDRDALRFTVRQRGRGFCHLHTRTCWGEDHGLPPLFRTLASRALAAPEGSYTRRLLDDADLLAAKLREEVRELADASGPEEVAHEVADVIFFAAVAAVRAGVDLADVGAQFDRRALRVRRRPGNAKPEGEE